MNFPKKILEFKRILEFCTEITRSRGKPSTWLPRERLVEHSKKMQQLFRCIFSFIIF